MTSFVKKITRSLFPYSREEKTKFIPLMILGFCIGINYTILRNIKDAILITADKSGAEVIPFIKLWGVIPCAVLFTYIYSKLSHKYKHQVVFNSFLLFFMCFFLLFVTIIYPFRESLHLHNIANWLETHGPAGIKGFSAMIRYWSFSFFYILSEMWGSMMLSVMFWRLISDLYSLKEAKSIFSLFCLATNLSAIFAGNLSVFISSAWLYSKFTIFDSPWQQALTLSIIITLISGMIIFKTYKRATASIAPSILNVDRSSKKHGISNTKKPSFIKSIIRTATSPYLACIAMLVLSYNISIHLSEVIWKQEVKNLYPSAHTFNAYMCKVSIYTGIISSIIELFFTRKLLGKFGWKFTALCTPIIMLITASVFFPLLMNKNTATLNSLLAMIGTSPLPIIVLIGSIQNVISRGCKFSIFDTTKEMTFIPLSKSDRSESKSIIDGIGSRLGKSGGSLMYQLILIICSSLTGAAPVIGIIIFSIITLWIISISFLNAKIKQYDQKEPSLTTTPNSENTPVNKMSNDL